MQCQGGSNTFEQVDRFVQAFESAWADGSAADFADYLPSPTDPLYLAVLIELVRVDLEFRLERGESACAADYLQRFPILNDDPSARRAVTYEEQRLRQTASIRTNGRIAPPTAGRLMPRVPSAPGYEILEELGSGGMGVVYKARQVALNRLVALKVIHPDRPLSEDARARFLAEAQVVAELKHPNILQIHEVGEHEGAPFLCLELVEGGSLADRISRRAQPPRSAAQLVRQLAEAVDHAHSRNIVHCDLKPGNVLLQPRPGGSRAAAGPDESLGEYVPKLSDFGLAHRLHDEPAQGGGLLAGTPGYMAPEQALGKRALIGPPADIYALGAILYYLLTGRPPFVGSHATLVLEQVVTSTPPPLDKLRRGVPRDLAAVCLKCLAKDPAARYRTAADLADELGRYLRGESVHARRASGWERAGKWARRHPGTATVVALLALGAVLALAGGLYHHAELQEALGLAEKHARDLKDANSELEETNRELKTQRAIAEQKGLDAIRAEQRRLKELTSVLEEAVLDVARLRNLPAAERRARVRTYKDYLQKLIGDESGDWFLRSRQADACFVLARIESAVGLPSRATELYREARDRYQELRNQFPADVEFQRALAACEHNLGVTALVRRDLETAEHHFRSALALRRKLAGEAETPRSNADLAATLDALGVFEAIARRAPAAEAAYRESLLLRRKLVAAHSDRPEFRHDLATTLTNLALLRASLGQTRTAQQELREAIKLWTGLPSDHPEHRSAQAAAHDQLGLLHGAAGRLNEARDAHERANALRKLLSEDYPDHDQYRAAWARSQINLGNLHRARKDPAAAGAAYTRAQAVHRDLLSRDPDNAVYRAELAGACNNFALLLAEGGKAAEAEAMYSEAFRLYSSLAEQYPALPQYRQELAGCHNNLASLYRALKDPGQAARQLKCGLALLEPLVRNNPRWPELAVGLASLRLNLGLVRADERNWRDAVALFSRAVEALDALRDGSGGSDAGALLRKALGARAAARVRLQDYAEALADWDRLLALKPRPAWEVELARAATLARLGDHAAAAAAAKPHTTAESAEVCLSAAAVFGLAHAAALRDTRLGVARARLLREYAHRAVELLARAFADERLPTAVQLDRLRKDGDLASLRDHPAFQELLRTLERQRGRRE
jgi:serine/threonine protein kinase